MTLRRANVERSLVPSFRPRASLVQGEETENRFNRGQPFNDHVGFILHSRLLTFLPSLKFHIDSF